MRGSKRPKVSIFALLGVFSQPGIVLAQGAQTPQSEGSQVIIVTASRQALPKRALPATIQIISAEQTRVQSQIGGSAIDAVSALVPSFSPTRQKMSGAGETLRGRSPPLSH